MRIIVCCKVVPEEQDISVTTDRRLDLSRATAKISQYDLNAIECAMQLAGPDDQVIALTAGPKKWLDNTKIRKDILSRGPASLEIVMDDKLADALPEATADVLAAAVRKLGFDLVICGEGSGDLYAQQVGPLLGEKLGVPSINAVQAAALEGGSLVVERALDQEVEILEMSLPAAIAVTSDINVPKIPTMKAILAAGKKPSNVQDCAACGVEPKAFVEIVSVLAPEASERLNKIVEGDGDDAVAAFVESIRKVLQ